MSINLDSMCRFRRNTLDNGLEPCNGRVAFLAEANSRQERTLLAIGACRRWTLNIQPCAGIPSLPVDQRQPVLGPGDARLRVDHGRFWPEGGPEFISLIPYPSESTNGA